MKKKQEMWDRMTVILQVEMGICPFCRHPAAKHDQKWGCKETHMKDFGDGDGPQEMSCMCYSGDGKTHDHGKLTSCTVCLMPGGMA